MTVAQDLNSHERLTKVFREVFEDNSLEIQDDHGPEDIPGWDSLAHVNLLVSIETEFNIRLSTAEMASLERVGDIKGLIVARGK